MNFMMDLETGGKTPGCAIVSVGIIAFDPLAPTVDALFPDFGYYSVVNRESCMDAFLHEDTEGPQSTMAWWSRQSGEAREALHAYRNNQGKDLAEVLEASIEYVAGHCTPKNAKVFGNGSDFDNAIVAVAARQVGLKVPWSYGGRCYRTMKSLDAILGPEFAAPALTRSGTYHNALDDAKTQAMHLWEIVQSIRSNLATA